MIGLKKQFISFSQGYNDQLAMIDNPNGPDIVNCQFESKYQFDFSGKGLFRGNLFYHEMVRSKVLENTHFTYPVIIPDRNLCYDNVIILFHGLNEKNWDKYFVWASYLAEKMNRPVILFPLAYHMNRVPKSWSDPRVMGEIAKTRKSEKEPANVSFANAALSTRLQFHPELFIYSGMQSCYDVLDLIGEIRNGTNRFLTKDAHIDLFSYSIGAFFSQILMLANPGNHFDKSKLFIFCGGPTFDSMYGDSKFIMDSVAYKSLLELKHRQKLKQIKKKVFATGDKTLLETWPGLELMMSRRRDRKRRESIFDAIKDRLYVVALEKDKVMPVECIIKTVRGKRGNIDVPVEVIDFPYDYSHEQPFPLGDDKIQHLVDRSFTVVFDKAVEFFRE